MKLGLQLWTVRDMLAQDPERTFAAVRSAGYEGVELPCDFDQIMPPDRLLRLLAQNNLTLLGATLTAEQIAAGEWDDLLSYYRVVSCPALVCAGIFSVPGNAQGWRDIAAQFQAFGQRCAQDGIRFLYHIHGHEFTNVDGQRGIDHLLEALDPACAGIEADIYWIKWGGADPAELIRRYFSLFDAVHLKDTCDASAPERFRDTEVGAGVLDIPEILRLCAARGLEWVIVEQEAFDLEPEQSIQISAQNITALIGALALSSGKENA